MTQGSIGRRVLCASTFAAMLVGCAADAATQAASLCALTPPSVTQSLDIPVVGRESARRVIDVPPDAELEIVASEQNVDVMLELPDLGSIADNPARRLGPERIVARTGGEPQLAVVVRGKERNATQGRVHIDVIQLASVRTRCDNARALLAQGDAGYARAQLAARGERVTITGSVREEYAAAAASYDSAIRALEDDGPSPLLAHALLAAAAAYYQDLQDWKGAETRSERAATTYGDVGDTYGVARSRAMRAAASMEVALSMPAGPHSTRSSSASALLARTREEFDDIATFHAQRGERFDQALAANNLGIAYYYEGRFDQALAAYGLARPL